MQLLEIIKIKRLASLVFLCLICLLLAGCPARQTGGKVQNSQGSYTVTDDSGYTMTLAAKPQRIASLSYGTDEMLVELVAMDRILAFSRWADDPEITFITAGQAAQVKKRALPYAEALIALRPDLIVAATSTLRPEALQTLREVGIPVYISKSPKNLEEVKHKVGNLARVVGEENNGQRIINRMEEALQRLEEKLAPVTPDKRKCGMAFDFSGVIGSKSSLLADIFNYARIKNGALREGGIDQGENRLSKEQIVAINPDIFLLPTWNYDGYSGVQAYRQQIMNDPAFRHVAAVRNNQVKLVSDRYRYVTSQHVVISIEVFARTAYPELF